MKYNFDEGKLLKLIDERYTLSNIVGELAVALTMNNKKVVDVIKIQRKYKKNIIKRH